MENLKKTTTPVGIMNCPTEEVTQLCRDLMRIIDDLQQVCMIYMQDELEALYNQIEATMKVVELMESVSTDTRNEVRLTAKHIISLAAIIDDIYAKAN